ncbi:HAD family phosphatase [Chitinimonas sp. BJYL2]|uniref:HAD family hydrolase n=1 Tax=Chitinimonas sp. BJYL2 TaxID=2976696 RepID=UPI0022B3516A|nr:HAD family phosphatase [Chitinimonas sp. BJYL2]
MTPLDFTPAAVLFDMDGLMIDSERAVMESWRDAARDHQITLEDDLLHAMVGMHEKLCYAILRERRPDLDTMAILNTCDAHYHERVMAGLPLKPGIVSLLRWLRDIGMPRAVATSTRRDRADQKLANTGLIEFFPLVVTGSDIEHPKPAPDIYLKAAAGLGVRPQDCLVLEDSEPGVRAALAAGMTPIQIPDMKPPSAELLAFGHRVAPSLGEAEMLLRARLGQQVAS